MKKPNQRAGAVAELPSSIAQASEEIAKRLADKPYGEPPREPVNAPADDSAELVRATVMIPKGLIRRIEARVFENKQKGRGEKSASALYRAALLAYLDALPNETE